MPVTETETLTILTRRRIDRSRNGHGPAVHHRLSEIGAAVREQILVPYLKPSVSGRASDAVREAARRLRALRIEANWLVAKHLGWKALLARSEGDLKDLRTALARSGNGRTAWGRASLPWLDRLLREQQAVQAVLPLLEAYAGFLNRVPLEAVERLLPGDLLLSADVEALALHCIAAVLDREIREADSRRLLLAVRSATRMEADYIRLLRAWTKIATALLQTPERFAGANVSSDPLSAGLVAMVGIAQGNLEWLPRLVHLCEHLFEVPSPFTMRATVDPEEEGLVKLRIHVPTSLPSDRLIVAESRFWAEAEQFGPQLFELITLSFRAAENGSPPIP